MLAFIILFLTSSGGEGYGTLDGQEELDNRHTGLGYFPYQPPTPTKSYGEWAVIVANWGIVWLFHSRGSYSTNVRACIIIPNFQVNTGKQMHLTCH